MSADWKYGLFDCFGDCPACLCGCFCPLCAAGETSEIVSQSYIKGFCSPFCCAYPCCVTTPLREKKEFKVDVAAIVALSFVVPIAQLFVIYEKLVI